MWYVELMQVVLMGFFAYLKDMFIRLGFFFGGVVMAVVGASMIFAGATAQGVGVVGTVFKIFGFILFLVGIITVFYSQDKKRDY